MYEYRKCSNIGMKKEVDSLSLDRNVGTKAAKTTKSFYLWEKIAFICGNK